MMQPCQQTQQHKWHVMQNTASTPLLVLLCCSWIGSHIRGKSELCRLYVANQCLAALVLLVHCRQDHVCGILVVCM
jgi:hypothetical protein